MKRVLVFVVILLAWLMTTPMAWSAAKIEINDASWMEVGFLGQLHYSYSPDPNDFDFYLRRGRIILSGQIIDGVKFFAETDNDNAGKSGGAAVSTDIQDAFVDIRLFKSDIAEGWLKAGLILLPFSFENRSSAGTLLGNDYNAEVIKLAHTFVWRDYGLEYHGNIKDRFTYCLGIFDGYDEPNTLKNPDSSLRVTGHAAVNILGQAESGWFFSQERLGKKGKYLSLGAGLDWQARATLITSDDPEVQPVIKDSSAWVVDVQSGFPLGKVGITANAGYYQWKNYSFEGSTAFIEAGAMFRKLMVTAKFSMQEPVAGDSVWDANAGIHYFFKDHRARMGLEYRTGDSPDMLLLALQMFP